MNLQNFDLNLLLALDALLKEKHVTRAAARVGLSQPAMSNALARLRELLGDPVLVRTAKGMVPTPRAERLLEPLRSALRAAEQVLADPSRFTPETAELTFDLMTSDAIAQVLLPQVIARLQEHGPRMSMRMHALTDDEPWEALESARVDLLAGVWGDAPAGIRQVSLYEERFVCLVREGHPLVGETLTLEQYVALSHLLVSTTRTGLGTSSVDRVLEKHGLKRHIVLWLPHFLAAPFVVAHSDHIVTFPSRLAHYYATLLPLRIVPPPLELPAYSIRLFWHERLQRETAHAWLRGQICEVAAALDAPGAPARAGARRQRSGAARGSERGSARRGV